MLENLDGGIAWKDPEQAERQKERQRAKKEKEEAFRAEQSEEVRPRDHPSEEEECQEQGINLSM